jgi:hypothetical protein
MSSGLPRCLTSVVGRTRQHPTCRKIERNDMDLLGVKIGAELLPIGRREAREAVDLLDEQHVVGPESAMSRNSSGRASFVLDILSHDIQAMLGGERFD